MLVLSNCSRCLAIEVIAPLLCYFCRFHDWCNRANLNILFIKSSCTDMLARACWSSDALIHLVLGSKIHDSKKTYWKVGACANSPSKHQRTYHLSVHTKAGWVYLKHATREIVAQDRGRIFTMRHPLSSQCRVKTCSGRSEVPLLLRII